MSHLRKGQHLFNEIARTHELGDHRCTMNGLDLFPYYNLHQVLYYMQDEEFDAIMTKLSLGDAKNA